MRRLTTFRRSRRLRLPRTTSFWFCLPRLRGFLATLGLPRLLKLVTLRSRLLLWGRTSACCRRNLYGIVLRLILLPARSLTTRWSTLPRENLWRRFRESLI